MSNLRIPLGIGLLALLMCWGSGANGKSTTCTIDCLPAVIVELGAGDTIFIDTSPAERGGSVETIILVDVDSDGISELRALHRDGRISWWNLDGSRCLRMRDAASEEVNQRSSSTSGASVTPGVPQTQPGWPVTLDRTVLSSAVFGNLVGDEKLEVVVGGNDDKVHVWDAFGNEQPGWPQQTQSDVESSPVLGDIDSDGGLEVVVGCWDRYVYAWNADGSSVDGLWPVLTDGVIVYGSAALGDIDQDEELETVIACYYGPTATLYVLNGDGTNAENWPLYFSESIHSTPGLADIDTDGKLEVIVGSRFASDGKLWAFNGEDASVVDGWPVALDRCVVESSPALGDIDDDDTVEIVIGTSYWGGCVWVLNADGSVQEGWPIDVGNNVIASPALADLDNDGDLEVIAATGTYLGSPLPARLFIWHHDGQEVDNWPVSPVGIDEEFRASPVVADIDADSELEIIVATADFNASPPVPDLYAFEYDANLVNDSWPLIGEDIVGTPALADIDYDGQLELAVGTWYVSEFWCWELGEGTYPAFLAWPMYHHDRWHTGYSVQFSCGDVDGNNVVNVSDAVFLLAYIFAGGSAPEPLEVGDADFNALVNISDVVYLVAYIFGGGPKPCD